MLERYVNWLAGVRWLVVIVLLYEFSLPYGLDLNDQINVDKSASRFTVATSITIGFALLADFLFLPPLLLAVDRNNT